MKIMLLAPPCNLKDRYNNKMNIRRGYMVPLGLAMIATVLENNGHEVSVLDLQVLNLSFNEVVKKINEFKPAVLGFTALTPTFDKAVKLAKYVKEKTKLKIIFGGPHVSCFPEDTMKDNKFIDIIVIGEGEYASVEILERLEANKSLSDVNGIIFRENNKIIRTKPRQISENLDELPIPSRKFFNMKLYSPLPNQYKVLPAANMITSRGCSYGKCTYCFEAGRLGHKYRRISPMKAIEEIKMLISEYGIKEISFWDDEFVNDKKWVTEFCNLLKKEKIKIMWSCYARVNFVSKEIIKKMADAGCWNIFFGLESGNQELLNKIRKGITLEQIKRAIQWTDEIGIESRGSFMLALPGETPEMGMKTIDFACSLPLDYAQFLLTTPFPGTVLFEQCKNDGKLNMDYRDYSIHKPVFVPNGYKDEKQIQVLNKLAYRKFYFRPSYILRHIKRIKGLEDIKKYILGLKFLIGMS